MKKIWTTITGWLQKNAPGVVSDLQAPAAKKAIAAAEKKMNVVLPDDMKESLAIHNGQLGGAASLMEEWMLLPIEAIADRWRILKAAYRKRRDQYGEKDSEQDWNEKMIPIAFNGTGDYYCIDLDENNKKKYGAITILWHVDDNTGEVIAKSYKDMLADFAKDLQEGKYTYTDDKIVKN